jgi:hypothetical protein
MRGGSGGCSSAQIASNMLHSRQRGKRRAAIAHLAQSLSATGMDKVAKILCKHGLCVRVESLIRSSALATTTCSTARMPRHARRRPADSRWVRIGRGGGLASGLRRPIPAPATATLFDLRELAPLARRPNSAMRSMWGAERLFVRRLCFGQF